MDDESRNTEALVSAANAAYYDAFERKDFAAMARLWEPGERTVCTHPGWAPLRGTDAILESYAAIFNGPQRLQFILTEERIVVQGTLAYISVDENLVDESGATSATASLNVFAWNDQRWRMLVHHASPIMTR